MPARTRHGGQKGAVPHRASVPADEPMGGPEMCRGPALFPYDVRRGGRAAILGSGGSGPRSPRAVEESLRRSLSGRGLTQSNRLRRPEWGAEGDGARPELGAPSQGYGASTALARFRAQPPLWGSRRPAFCPVSGGVSMVSAGPNPSQWAQGPQPGGAGRRSGVIGVFGGQARAVRSRYPPSLGAVAPAGLCF